MTCPAAAAADARWPRDAGDPPFIGLAGGRLSGQAHAALGHAVTNPATGAEDGVFARWSWDGRRLEAEVDPLGFFSLFLWQRGDRILLSPSILQLIAQGAECRPDDRALGVFFRLGLFLDEDTPFRDIKVLPPGGRLVWEAGTLSLSRAEHPARCAHTISRRQAVEALIELPRQALDYLSRSARSEIVLPLSGGRDSRHILLALHHLGRPPASCVTFQHAARRFTSETRAARAICERLGQRHEVLAAPRPEPQDMFRTLVLTSLCADEHVQMMPMHDYLRHGGQTALDGIAGDILTNPDDAAAAHYARAQAGDFEAIARAMMQGHAAVLSRPGQTGGPGALFAPQSEDAAIDTVTRAIAAHADAPDPYQSFWFWNRTRREIGFVPSAMFGAGRGVLCPYLDSRFVRFFLSLPYAVTRDQQLHNEALARGYPGCADVGFGDSFAPAPPARRNPLRRVRKALQGIGAILALTPAHPLAELRAYLVGSPMLRRRPAEMLQLYRLALEGMDADLARAMLRRAARDAARAPRPCPTDRFIPEARPA